MLTFKNGRVITPEGVRQDLYVQTEGTVICSITDVVPEDAGRTIDLGGRYLAPGFIDIHCHGGGGHDFMDNSLQAMQGALACHMRHGTTTLVPTTVSGSLDELRALGETMRAYQASPLSATLPYVPGLHLEGPYIAMAMRGAQDADYIKTPAELPPQDVLDALGRLPLIWTVAPEIPGVIALCCELAGKGVRFSAGHSDADYADAKEAADAGFTMVTHLYSAMSTIHRVNGYRVSGLLEAGFMLDELAAELIADGAHIPPELLRLAVRTKGVDGTILVTDAMRGADMPPGEYMLGSLKNGQLVQVDSEVARMPDGINFAGSVATADRLVRTMVQRVGTSIEDAVAMMTRNPARAIGLEKQKGSIAEGMDADFTVFDDDIAVDMVVIGGKICYQREGE